MLGAPTMEKGLTYFNQTVAAEDGDGERFAGQANVWDLDNDFSLDDGDDDQFDGALELSVGGDAFPFDQDYDELVYYTPGFGTADGVKLLAVNDGTDGPSPLGGTYSLWLNAATDAYLRQTLDLTAASGTVTLSWDADGRIGRGIFDSETAFFRIVVRSAADGSLLDTAFAGVTNPGPGTFDLSTHAGSTVVLSIEWGGSDADRLQIDDISVTDDAATEFVTNGDFETGDTSGWTNSTPMEYQNVTSGVRTLAGLDVTRSFYTVPNQLWGRWVDVLENNTAAEITATATYDTDLGSDDYGIIYATPGTAGGALTTWDGGTDDRDIGMVFGGADTVTFTSDDGLDNGNGSEEIQFTFDLVVPPGGRVAIVNFIVMTGQDTGGTASDITARATRVDTANQAIHSGFWSDSSYRDGMTQEQLDAVLNF